MASSRFVSILALAGLALAGCSTSVRFNSKTGRSFDALTRTAVHCEENEAQVVAAAGAEVIGSISGKALTADAITAPSPQRRRSLLLARAARTSS